MKLLEIRLKNINSLRGEHYIPFDRSPLRESGLFGIVGSMGSGKSTLLDCITLALYGRVQRFEKIRPAIEKGGSILTKHEKDCYAQVKYSCSKGVFTSRWSIGKTRNNTFKAAEMQVFDEAGEMINGTLSGVPDVNVANIGLDYDQFIKSILLCQGEFAKFLKSDKHERALLLEKITGISQFRKIGTRAFHAYNERKKKIDAATDAMKKGADRLMGNEAREALEKEVAAAAENIRGLQQNLDEARLRLEHLKRILQLTQDIAQREKEKEQARKELEHFRERHGEALGHYNKLFGHREELLMFQRLERAIEGHAQKTRQLEDEINTWRKRIDQQVAELREWVGEEVSGNDYLDHLRSFRDKVVQAINSRRTLQKQLQPSLERISNLLRSPDFAEEKRRFRQDGSNEQLLIQLRSRQSDEAAAYKALMEQYGFDAGRLEAQRAEQMDMSSHLAMLHAAVRDFKLRVQQVRQSEEKLASLRKEASASRTAHLKAELDLLEKEKNEAEKEREELLHARKLDELRTTLKEGEPCPLCGSAHHPYLHEFANSLLERSNRYELSRKAWQEKKHAWENAELADRVRANAIQTEEKSLGAMLAERETIQSSIEVYKQKLGLEKVGNEEMVLDLIHRQKEKLAGLDACTRYRQIQPLMAQLEKEVCSYDEQNGELSRVEQELHDLYKGEDIEGEARIRETAFNDARNGLKVAMGLLDNSRKLKLQDEQELQDLGARLNAALVVLGYAGVKEASARLISEAEQKALTDEESRLMSALVLKEGAVKVLEKQLAESGEPGTEEQVVLQEQLVKDLAVELQTRSEQREEKSGQLRVEQERMEQLKEEEQMLRKMQEEIRPWEILHRLIGDSSGNKFNNMAQELTLQHLLVLANHRMKKLHSRYTIIMPGKLEDDDLRVADGYMGGEVRTVRSLSGGETFVISLALALGLSDLASRDIRIESLFIDEGFGSLDPDTLEEAMSTLEQLQSESNKMVGIISHVESLKERIYTQIRLEKGSNGFSTIKIFPENKTDEPES